MKKHVILFFSLIFLVVFTSCGSDKSINANAGTDADQMNSITEVQEVKIPMTEVVNKSAVKAKDLLLKAGFESVVIVGGDDNWDQERMIVVEQNHSSGELLSPKTKIILTCKHLCRLFFDISSDNNLLLNKYDMDIYIDDVQIGTVSNGKQISGSVDILEGEHTVYAYKAGTRTVSDYHIINITDNTVFNCDIAHGADIQIKNAALIISDADGTLSVVDVIGMTLPRAKALMASAGFTSVHVDADVWVESNWIVTGQSIAAGERAECKKDIILHCEKIDNFVKEKCLRKSLQEAYSVLSQTDLKIVYLDNSSWNDISSKVYESDDEYRACWEVDTIQQNNDSGAIILNLSYLGTLEEQAAAKAAAEAAAAEAAAEAAAKAEAERIAREEAEAKAAAEAAARAEEERKKQEEEAAKKAVLEAFLPMKTAQSAIIVAYTNMNSIDVFSSDGNTYDKSKFHGINYTGEFQQKVWREGTWSYVDDKTWHVDNLYLIMNNSGYDQAAKLNCNITFDGVNYTIYHLKYMTASSKYIDTNDPNKTSGWMTMEPSESNVFLYVSPSLLK